MSVVYNDIVAAIEARTGYTIRNGESRCPCRSCHPSGDRNPSMSITHDHRGVGLKCHKPGCETKHILAAIDRTMADLFEPDSWDTTRKSNGLGPEKVRYIYQNAEGQPVFSVTRHDPKAFRQWRPDGRGGWIKGAKGIDKPLYHLPEVLNAIEKGEPIYVVEGEKDVEALRRAGLVATTNAMGAQGEKPGAKWKPSYTQILAKAATVKVIADDDPVGHAHARYVASELRKAGCASVEMCRPHEGHKDIAEHLGAERSLKELRPLEDDDEPETEEEQDPGDTFVVDLVSGEAIHDLPKPEPMVGTWLDRGMLAQLVGVYGSGKSFVAMELGLSVATGRDWLGQPIHHQGEVLYVAAEGGYTFPDRVQGWTEESGRKLPGNFHLYPIASTSPTRGSWEKPDSGDRYAAPWNGS